MMTSHTLYYSDGDHYTGPDALDRLWAGIVADDPIAAISPELAQAAHDAIDAASVFDTPMNLTPDHARSVIREIEVR